MSPLSVSAARPHYSQPPRAQQSPLSVDMPWIRRTLLEVNYQKIATRFNSIQHVSKPPAQNGLGGRNRFQVSHNSDRGLRRKRSTRQRR